MLIGAIDPLEGSIAILPGVGLVAIGALLGPSRHLRLLVRAFVLVATGVGVLWGLSLMGGIGGSSGHSIWWGLLLLPYPIGWIMGLWGAFRMLRAGPRAGMDQAERRPMRDMRPSWFSVLLSTMWIGLSWQIYGRLIGQEFEFQIFSVNHPEMSPPPADNFFVQFFGFHVLWTTFAIAALILGKDLFIMPLRSRIWNIAFAVLCGALIIGGWEMLSTFKLPWGTLH